MKHYHDDAYRQLERDARAMGEADCCPLCGPGCPGCDGPEPAYAVYTAGGEVYASFATDEECWDFYARQGLARFGYYTGEFFPTA